MRRNLYNYPNNPRPIDPMYPLESILTEAHMQNTITSDMVVSDVVFNPSETLFLQSASGRGAKTVNGLGMLACQGARNFTLWTGREAPLEVMIGKLKEEFGEM